jgi:hypothetical protein
MIYVLILKNNLMMKLMFLHTIMIKFIWANDLMSHGKN